MSFVFTNAHRGGAGSPLVCLHGFTDTWRSWELVLPALEREHDVLAPTLPGHAGGRPLPDGAGTAGADGAALANAVERVLDDAGFERAHVVGNSLGGYLALVLAARGRAESVVAFAPAGGWARSDTSFHQTLDHFTAMREQLKRLAPHADAIVRTPEGRRRATAFTSQRYEHIPPDLLAHQIVGVARCDAMEPLLASARRDGWPLDAERITCPVRIVWGTDDRLLPWPPGAARYRHDLLPHADWIVLDGVGHCPQLDVPLEAAQLILGFT